MVATKEYLAQVLELNNCPAVLVTQARAGFYHDFESPLAYPSVALINALQMIGKFDLVERVKKGEFDSSAEEAEEWLNTLDGEGKEILKKWTK